MGSRELSLKPLNKTDHLQPTKLCTFDIETIDWTKPYACGFYDGEIYKQFKDQFCIWEFMRFFLKKKYRGYVCFAHNGGKFDFNFILENIFKDAEFKDRFQVEPIRLGGRVAQIKISTTKKDGIINQSWYLRDSINYFKTSLKALTKSFNVPIKKGDFDHRKINFNNWKELEPEWSPYLKDDCISLYQCLQKWELHLMEDYNVRLKESMTIAQMAMRIFRINYLNQSIPTYQASEVDISKSYVGGRCEIFTRYGENLKYYDINSLYPYVMHENPIPVGVPIHTHDFTLKDFGVCYAIVQAPKDMKYPLLPHKTVDANKNPKLVFPRYKFGAWFCTPELVKAKELGYTVETRDGYIFTKEKIFKEYVDTLYKVKQNGKDAIEITTSKYFLNSIYGKFGQKREKEQMVIFPKDAIGYEPIDFFGDIEIYSRKVISKSMHILPAIASFITCYARLHLYSFIEHIEKQGGNVYYCDTDSVVCDIELDCDPMALGAMKDELKGETIIKGYFLLPKFYGMQLTDGSEILKYKGFPKFKPSDDPNIKEYLFNFEQIEKAVLFDDFKTLQFSKKRFAGAFESMRRNKEVVSMIDFARSVKTKYDKRVLSPNNIDTKPLDTPLNKEIALF